MLKHILTKVSKIVGLSLSDTDDRDHCLTLINEASKELWNSTDLPGCLQECIVQVNGSYEIALPAFVDRVRAVREYDTKLTWSISDVRPRYHYRGWNKEWNSWRDKGKFALAVDLTAITKLTFNIAAAETPAVTVYISGQTSSASNHTEEVSLTATGVQTVAMYESIHRIQKMYRNNYDIEIKDDAGVSLGVLYSDSLDSGYTVLDVSNYPFTIPPSSGETLCMEVLFKPVLNEMSEDGDSFPVRGYDDVIADKAIQLFYQSIPGQEQRALLFDQKAQRTADRLAIDINDGKTMMMEFQPHPHDSLFDDYD